MRILTFTHYYIPGFKGGGPIKTLRNLIEHTTSEFLFYRVMTSDRDLGDKDAYSSVDIGDWNKLGSCDIYYSHPGWVGLKEIAKTVCQKEYDFIYVNSFFSFRFSILPQLIARKIDRTVVLGPRGEFSRGALRLKPLKKYLFIKLYKFLGYHRSIIFQASSQYEAQDIARVLGKSVDIKIAEDIGSQDFVEKIPEKQLNRVRIVFISRISPKKNLLNAIELLKEIRIPISYDIYGPIEDMEYWRKCEKLIEQLPSHVQVVYKGILDPIQVVSTLSSYDMFFMPTLGENYGHVIAEAFSAGIPVLISDATPWRQLEEKGVGWDISLNDPKRFVDAIEEFSVLTKEEYKAKRMHIRDWAKLKFSQRDAIQANMVLFDYAYEKSRKE